MYIHLAVPHEKGLIAAPQRRRCALLAYQHAGERNQQLSDNTPNHRLGKARKLEACPIDGSASERQAWSRMYRRAGGCLAVWAIRSDGLTGEIGAHRFVIPQRLAQSVQTDRIRP